MTATSARPDLRLPPRWLSILVTLGIIALSLIISIVFTFAIISYAYAFAGNRIGSYDQLPLLGGGPSAALASAWLPGLIGAIAGFVVLFTPDHRRAWIYPAASIAVGFALVVISCLTFQQPPPMTGG